MCECDIIMLIFGIVALVKGRFSLTRNRVVESVPARIIGVVLMLPYPLSFLFGVGLAALGAARGKPMGEEELKSLLRVWSFGVVAGCLLVALGIAVATAKPVKKKRPRDEEEDDIPDEDDRPRPRRRRARPDEDDSPPPAAPGSDEPPRRPDDRFRA